MSKDYRQLQAEERSVIAVGLEQGLSRRAIARLLKRPVCTVSREINRNTGTDGTYLPQEATAQSKRRKFRRQKLLSNTPSLCRDVLALMGKGWSPEQACPGEGRGCWHVQTHVSRRS